MAHSELTLSRAPRPTRRRGLAGIWILLGVIALTFVGLAAFAPTGPPNAFDLLCLEQESGDQTDPAVLLREIKPLLSKLAALYGQPKSEIATLTKEYAKERRLAPLPIMRELAAIPAASVRGYPYSVALVAYDLHLAGKAVR